MIDDEFTTAWENAKALSDSMKEAVVSVIPRDSQTEVVLIALGMCVNAVLDATYDLGPKELVTDWVATLNKIHQQRVKKEASR